MPKEEYRLMLSDYWASSCKDLQVEDAQNLINKLEKRAIEAGVWSRYSHRGKMRYEHLKGRPGMATPKQLRMIEGLWEDVSYIHNIERRQRALRKFIFRIAGVSDMSFLESHHVKKVVNAIKNMRYRTVQSRGFRHDGVMRGRGV